MRSFIDTIHFIWDNPVLPYSSYGLAHIVSLAFKLLLNRDTSFDTDINSHFVRAAICFKVADKIALIITFYFKVIPNLLPRFNHCRWHWPRNARPHNAQLTMTAEDGERRLTDADSKE